MANGKTKNAVLWSIQGVLAAVFLFAGSVKLALPPEALKGPVALPVGFLRFIGMAEVAGAIGLILPGVLRRCRGLTPLAASCLVPIMIGATVITLIGGTVAPALIPLVIGTLSATVAYGRREALRARRWEDGHENRNANSLLPLHPRTSTQEGAEEVGGCA